ncbi:MAG: NADH-quinone oxidoreductase subunit B family protein [Helicobacteraceae bacterium]|jgi:Ni,Fe-hydrogenase III small subunit|nr:NADH-quinone oxidoreductase subunit B family protein [Helicobacteraceae bacterium]
MKLNAFRKKSPWILHYNAGSCNGCDIEILACLAPRYDIERLGMINKGNPKQSDVLLVTGPVTHRCRERLVELYAQMPEPKVVIAVGTCTCTGGVFRDMYHAGKGIDRFIPVDVYIAGCATRPEQIIEGVAKALDILERKNKEIEKPISLFGKVSKHDGETDRREMAGKVDIGKN